MPARQRRANRRLHHGLALAVALLAACLAAACTSVGYVAQAVEGHLDLVQRARPVPHWLADDSTSPALRERLLLAQQLRDFAVTELHLPDNRSYRSYADLGRTAAVWNVVAAPELSLTLKTWCVPVAGCVGYRGFFARDKAEALATELRAQGFEVWLYGVPAYSTLGRTDWLGGDPLLNTFIAWPEAELAKLIFHELAHQRVYAPGDTAFNESFAVAVERIGFQRWLAHRQGAHSEDLRRSAMRDDFRSLTQRTRADLQRIYDSPASDADKRTAKAQRMAAMRAEHAALRSGPWAGSASHDSWMAGANNAALSVQGTYEDGVPDFERLYLREGADLPRFYAAVRRLAALPPAQRKAALQAQAAIP